MTVPRPTLAHHAASLLVLVTAAFAALFLIGTCYSLTGLLVPVAVLAVGLMLLSPQACGQCPGKVWAWDPPRERVDGRVRAICRSCAEESGAGSRAVA